MLSEGVNLFAVCCYLDTINAQGRVEIGESFNILKVRCLMYPGGLKQKVGSVGGWDSRGNIFHVALIRNICYK